MCREDDVKEVFEHLKSMTLGSHLDVNEGKFGDEKIKRAISQARCLRKILLFSFPAFCGLHLAAIYFAYGFISSPLIGLLIAVFPLFVLVVLFVYLYDAKYKIRKYIFDYKEGCFIPRYSVFRGILDDDLKKAGIFLKLGKDVVGGYACPVS